MTISKVACSIASAILINGLEIMSEVSTNTALDIAPKDRTVRNVIYVGVTKCGDTHHFK